MKTLFILVLIGLAGWGGYYFGNNHGYEKAVFDQQNLDQNPDTTATEYSLSAAESVLVGVWRNSVDPRFTREFLADKSAVDLYDNGDSLDRTALSWNVFNDDAPDPTFKGEILPLTLYLHMSNGKEDLFFVLDKITPEALEMDDLDSGEVLTFIKEN